MKMSSLLNISPSSSSSMEKRKICPICDKSFANGKAMGGHMRAHLAKLPLPPKPNSNPHSSSSKPSLSRANRNASIVKPSAHRGASVANPSARQTVLVRSLHHGGGNPKPDLKRSVGESSKSNSVSSKSTSSSHHCLTDKEVALCLLKLMTDQWPEGVRPVIRVPLFRNCKRPRGESESAIKIEFKDEDDEDEDEDDEEYMYEDEEDDDVPFTLSRTRRSKKKSRGKYKCETCHMVFRSHQALGGHRASHKNKRVKISPDTSSAELEVDRSVGIRRIFRCQYCDKVFGSGQALGGHKKVHLSYLETGTTSTKTNRALIDLNLPAPLE